VDVVVMAEAVVLGEEVVVTLGEVMVAAVMMMAMFFVLLRLLVLDGGGGGGELERFPGASQRERADKVLQGQERVADVDEKAADVEVSQDQRHH